MLTTIIDLLSTASAIGLITTVAALGVAVLPWGAREAESAGSALDAAVRLPAMLMRPAPTPVPQAVRR